MAEEAKANVRASFMSRNTTTSRRTNNIQITINAKDIVLKPFTLSLTDEDGQGSHAASISKISDSLRRTKLQSFLSTPCFIQCLTDISHKLAFMQSSGDEKRLELIRDLAKVNEHLPARVYIPFVNDSARNYAVLHIASLESRIFQTKCRAPVLLCIEVYRPDELSEHVEKTVEPEKQPLSNVMTSKEFISKLKKKEESKEKVPIKKKLATLLRKTQKRNAGGSEQLSD